jgi:hypothetical protein
MTFREYVSAQDASGSISPHLALLGVERADRPARLNRSRCEEFQRDIDNVSGWQHVRADKNFLIIAGLTTTTSFIERIVNWLNKYEQDHAFIRMPNSDTAWKVLATGNRFVLGSWEKMVRPMLPD